jgi:hypothetical protein
LAGRESMAITDELSELAPPGVFVGPVKNGDVRATADPTLVARSSTTPGLTRHDRPVPAIIDRATARSQSRPRRQVSRTRGRQSRLAQCRPGGHEILTARRAVERIRQEPPSRCRRPRLGARPLSAPQAGPSSVLGRGKKNAGPGRWPGLLCAHVAGWPPSHSQASLGGKRKCGRDCPCGERLFRKEWRDRPVAAAARLISECAVRDLGSGVAVWWAASGWPHRAASTRSTDRRPATWRACARPSDRS